MVAGVRVLSLDEIGYGTGDGFRGWNCRHDWFPFFAEISELNYTEEQLKKLDEKHIELDGKLYTDYEVSQMQREAERKIRALKRELVCYDATGDKDGFSACSVKLKTAEQQLKDFLKETERDRESWREKVNKFDENNDSKRISDFKKELTFGEKSDIIKRDERIVSALKSGTITTKLNEDKQNPHILNSSEYDPAKNKSYFMISLEELQNIVDENYGTGEVTIGKNGIANAKEYITVSYDIGECIAEDGEHIGSTNRFRIHYSKSRTHAVPSKKKEENDESI